MKYLKLLVISTLFFLSSCSLHEWYKRDIRQGQIISESMVNQLEKGMHKDQVAHILGSPILNNFNENRWEYVQYHKKRGTVLVDKKLVLHFFGDKLEKYTYK